MSELRQCRVAWAIVAESDKYRSFLYPSSFTEKWEKAAPGYGGYSIATYGKLKDAKQHLKQLPKKIKDDYEIHITRVVITVETCI